MIGGSFSESEGEGLSAGRLLFLLDLRGLDAGMVVALFDGNGFWEEKSRALPKIGDAPIVLNVTVMAHRKRPVLRYGVGHRRGEVDAAAFETFNGYIGKVLMAMVDGDATAGKTSWGTAKW